MKRIVLAIICCFYSLFSHAQSGTYKFDDGTEVDVQIVSTRPDEGRKASIYIGALGPEPANCIGMSLYNPEKYYFNVMGGIFGGMVEGNIFLTSKLKKSTISQSVHYKYRNQSFGEDTKYVIKVPTQKRVSFGPHIGTSFYNYTFNNPFSAVGLITGLSIVKSRYAHWLIDGVYKARKGTQVSRINADVVFYVNRKLVGTPEYPVSLDELSRKIGYRIYFDGKTSLWSPSGRVAVHYMFGLGLTGHMKALPLLGGLGVGYNFL